MTTKVITKLNQLNKRFYETVGDAFDSSRQYFWKGWDNLLPYIKSTKIIKVLDVGCGNARFYEFLKQHKIKCEYVGVDNSQKLLNLAKENYPEATFINKDFVQEPSFISKLGKFDLVVSFGVVHHIPSYKRRSGFIKQLAKTVSRDGILMLSFWQFVNSYNLMKRKVEWEDIGLTSDDVEERDFLLDWQRGERAIRYCHWTGNDEAKKLLLSGNLQTTELFEADGESETLNLYAITRRQA